MKYYYVYILTNKPMGALYYGITSDLLKRVWEHKNKIDIKSFTCKYNINKLVYFEVFNDIEQAILREKRLKKWNRNWIFRLIIEENPDWKDLYNEL